MDPTTWERSRSYNFGYDSADGASRQETADEAGSDDDTIVDADFEDLDKDKRA